MLATPKTMTCTLLLSIMTLFGAQTLAQSHDFKNDDPENGELWLLESTRARVDDGLSVFGRFRATDDFGATRERDFRIAVHAATTKTDRTVTLHRFEPECLPLARLAGIPAEDFCDQISLTQDQSKARLEFASLDANHRYTLNLIRDERDPSRWQSIPQSAAEPQVTLSLSQRDDAIGWQWSIQGVKHQYRQSGVIPSDTFRETELSQIEMSLLGLSELLHNFNRWEFERSDLGRESPDWEPTPYAGWDENPVEGGCIFLICFGDLNNTGGGGGSSNDPDDPCNPRGNNYQPQNCPWDLTYATWPAALRTKIWKVSNDRFGFSMALKNVGTGDFNYGSFFIGSSFIDTPDMMYFTLRELGSVQPLITWAQASTGNSPYPAQNCWRSAYYSSLFGSQQGSQAWPFANAEMPPDAFVFHTRPSVQCTQASGRPSGRYKLFVFIDPTATYDEPTKRLNNIGDSGPLDWIHLRN